MLLPFVRDNAVEGFIVRIEEVHYSNRVTVSLVLVLL